MTGRPGYGCSRTTSASSTDPSGGRRLFAAAVVSLLALGAAAAPRPPASAAPEARGWLDVDYADLVDRRRLTHSGEAVGSLLARPGASETTALALLDPLLEPYGFVLPDALDTLAGAPPRPFVEVGELWQPGERQPAWAELLRSRSLIVESDGAGRMRVCAPSPDAGSTSGAQAYERAWPVLRLVFEAERRRLARKSGDRPEDHPLDVEVHPFTNERARTLFRLGFEPHRVRVTDTLPRGDRPPFDFAALGSFFDRRLLLEGGRLDPDGALHILGSDAPVPPEILGQPIGLSDWAVAYRAVFRGGLAEPYMSLDRGGAPQGSIVNYGGRLRDTSLGLVSLLCDVRFKTFSLGIDVATDQDVRERVRAGVPEFRTHLERFAADPGTRGVTGQQTRLWFYPDGVDLTLSQQGDVLVLRRARMTAASERVTDAAAGTRPTDPPWTLDTVAAINRDYAKLGGYFPELGSLDQVARLLSLFAWLRQAEAEGLAVPELDALLGVELPPLTTPRRFPQLLAFNALPPSGTQGAADVISQLPVGEGLDRLAATAGPPIAASRRLDRALRALDRTQADHARVAQEIESVDRSGLDKPSLDLLAYRAERLRMHHLVLSTLRPADRERLARREKGLRVFSVGIGGLDLGMSKRLALAAQRAEAGVRAAPGPESAAAAAVSPAGSWKQDSALLPKTELPDHGESARGAGPVRTEASASGKEGALSWTRTIARSNAPDPASRRLVFDARRQIRFVERLDDGRMLRFRMERDGSALRARLVDEGLPAVEPSKPSAAPAPAGLALLEIPSDDRRGAGSPETPAVELRVRGGGKGEGTAAFPRSHLERLVLGRELDLTPAEPLQGWVPAKAILGDARGLMVLPDAAFTLPPWEQDPPAVPGEEDPFRLAAAVRDWWRSEPGAPPVVIGVDRAESPRRWEKAPRPGGAASLLLPADAFAGPLSLGRDAIAASWKGNPPLAGLPSNPAARLVVLVSAEPPGVLGDRLRRLAKDPALSGRLLAVCALGGAVRADLPASLLAEGGLAGVGVVDAPPAGVGRVLDSLSRLSESLAASGDRRVEDLGGPFLWYF